jgi:hypothetical protein
LNLAALRAMREIFSRIIPRLNLRIARTRISLRISGLTATFLRTDNRGFSSRNSGNKPILRSFRSWGNETMAVKQTHVYRGHAIVHHVFATDETDEKIERFIVSQPGKNHQLATMASLAEAKAKIDTLLAAPMRQFMMNPA